MELKDFFLELVKQDNIEFTMRGAEITAEDVFSTRGLLPAFAKRADKICNLIFGYGIGASFKKIDASTLGEEVVINDSVPKFLQLHCFFHVVQELIDSSNDGRGRISVDELLYE